MKEAILALAIVAASAAGVRAEQPIGWLDLLSPDRFIQGAVQSGIFALRSQFDVSYSDMVVNLRSGSVSLSNVLIWPEPEWDKDGNCVVQASLATVTTTPFDSPDRLRARLVLSRVNADTACLPPEAGPILDAAKIDRILIPRLVVDLDYAANTGEASVHAYGGVSRLANLDFLADFSYFGLRQSKGSENVEPAAFLRRAALVVENAGGWNVLGQMLPPQATDPAKAGPFIQGMLTQIITGMNTDGATDLAESGEAELSPAQSDFIDSAVAAWTAFLRSPEKLVLETGYSASNDVMLDFKAYDRDPKALFADLQPRLVVVGSETKAMISASLLRDAIETPDKLTPDDRRKAGLALLTGEGAPRYRIQGRKILEPLANGGDGAAAWALSDALGETDPKAAYRFAMIAGAQGFYGAAARMDRLEAVIGLSDALAVQEEMNKDAPHPVSALANTRLMRERAISRLTGEGRLRSYSLATLWARLGTAAGDPEAAAILAEIDDKFRHAPPADQGYWSTLEEAAARLAIQAWVGRNLPKSLSRAD